MSENSLIKLLDHYVSQGRPSRVNVEVKAKYPTQRFPISPEFAQHFNLAGGLMQQGRANEALEKFGKIFEATHQARIASAEFIALVELQKAYCLMDLTRYEEARTILASDQIMIPVTTCQFTGQDTFYYFFSYGNTLAALRDEIGMERQLSRALWFAAQELGDAQLSARAWHSLIELAEYMSAWPLMLTVSSEAGEFATNMADANLFSYAAAGRARAYKARGDYKEARRWARYMIELYQRAGRSETVKTWQMFLGSLPQDSADS